MTPNVEQPLEGVIVAILLVGAALMLTLRWLSRVRPDFRVGAAVTVAYVVRLLAIAALNATGLGASLRGGDETTFLDYATHLAQQPLGHGDFPHGLYQLQTVVFAMEIKLGFLNETAMRVVQVGIALLGVALMLGAVYDLGGPRAARLAAWLLAFEPASIFFGSELHRESLLELAAGMTVLGCTWVWQRLDIRGILLAALGCLIAIEIRSYAGWFMACGVTMIVLHASLRHMTMKLRALPLLYGIIVVALIVAPTLYAATGGKNLKRLQSSQQANAYGIGEGSGTANSDNLALEQVDFSSRGAVITSLPTKVRELLLEPYPWQLDDASQMFGAVGTLVVYAVILLLVRYMWLSRGHIFERAGPFLYILLTQMIAYSLTVGNAGTGFRYRSHLTMLAIAALAILRSRVREQRPSLQTGQPRDNEQSVRDGRPVLVARA